MQLFTMIVDLIKARFLSYKYVALLSLKLRFSDGGQTLSKWKTDEGIQDKELLNTIGKCSLPDIFEGKLNIRQFVINSQ